MAVNLSPIWGAGAQLLDNSGNVLSGGKIYTYAAGTTTPATTYTSSSGLVANSNPIIANSAGRLTDEIWLTDGASYKFVLKNSDDVLIGTYDNLEGINDFSEAFADLANTTDPAKGDALIGFRQSNASGNLTDAVGRTVHQKLQEFISVKDFGATGDGATDDAATIQNAIDAVSANDGGILFFPPGDYVCNSQIELKDNVFIKGSGPSVTTLDFSQKGYFSNTEGMIIARGPGTSGEVTVTATVSEGEVAIPVSSITGFSPNDYVQIRSTEVLWAEATVGEVAKVQWADSGYVYLKSPLAYTYDSGAGTITLAKAEFIYGGMSDIKIKGAGVNPAGYPSPTYTGTPSEVLPGTSRGDLGIEIQWGYDWTFENIEFIGVEYRAITMFSCANTMVQNCTITFDSINQLSQYGVSFWGSCINSIVQNNKFFNGRHHVTTLSTASVIRGDYYRGMPVGIVMNANTCKGSWVYPLDTHRAGTQVVISNNTIESLSGGIEIRTPKTSVIGNVICLPEATGETPGVTLAHGVACYYSNNDIVISNNNITGGTLGIGVSSPTTNGANVVITNNKISQFQGTGVYIISANGFTISNNIIIRPSSATAYGIGIYDSKYGTVCNNAITVDTPTSTYGIYASATASGDTTSVTISSNTLVKLSGTVYGVGFNNNVTNSLVGYNETSTCNTAYVTGTNTTNKFVDRGYYGTITIASGAIDCPLETDSFALDTEGGAATDDLDTINGGTNGQTITIKSVTAARVPTLKDGTGNLRLAGDYAIANSASTITLIKISTLWLEVARSTN